MSLRILYRGPLASCNYDCSYCPFAKHRSSDDELARDRGGLGRFVEWVRGHGERDLSILFTPWGEALIRPWYREAMIALSHLGHVRRVAAQTNLSCGIDWLEWADKSRLALWVTYHPGEVAYERFIEKCRALHRHGVRHSVGMVGLREAFASVEQLRRDLPASTYVWINAYKRGGAGYYSEADRAFLESVDPLFGHNAQAHPSRGRDCDAGETAITVDGEGVVRRCHFVDEVLGNLYHDDLTAMLRQRPCPRETCSCHIGYVNLAHLGLGSVYGEGLLERIPRSLPVLRA